MMTARRLSLDDIDHHMLLLLSIMGCECMGERWRRRQDGNEHRAKSHHDHNQYVCTCTVHIHHLILKKLSFGDVWRIIQNLDNMMCVTKTYWVLYCAFNAR
jgi:hypothetical protein